MPRSPSDYVAVSLCIKQIRAACLRTGGAGPCVCVCACVSGGRQKDTASSPRCAKPRDSVSCCSCPFFFPLSFLLFRPSLGELFGDLPLVGASDSGDNSPVCELRRSAMAKWRPLVRVLCL